MPSKKTTGKPQTTFVRCSTCKRWKAAYNFFPSAMRRGRGRCKQCCASYSNTDSARLKSKLRSRAWYASHKKRAIKNSMRWRVANRDRYREWHKKYTADIRDKRRDYQLKRNYGMSLDDYNQILLEQGGQCACCPKRQNSDGRSLHVDHDHKTGKIRGLLCSHCNLTIGRIGDSPERALKIAAYLTKIKNKQP